MGALRSMIRELKEKKAKAVKDERSVSFDKKFEEIKALRDLDKLNSFKAIKKFFKRK